MVRSVSLAGGMLLLALAGCAQLVGADFSDLREGQAGGAGAPGQAGQAGQAGQGGQSAASGGSAGAVAGASGVAGVAGVAGAGGMTGVGGAAGSGGASGQGGVSGQGGGGASTQAGQGGGGGSAQAGQAGEGGGAAQPAHCRDGAKDDDETDVDCGGSCRRCDIGGACEVSSDCFGGVCEGGSCAETCPSDMVLVTGAARPFCVDAHEVTQAQYAAFVARGPAVGEQPAMCADNESFAPASDGGGFAPCLPTSYAPADKGDRPVVCVDWCDARAYCEAVGKRLCGNAEKKGETLGPERATNAHYSEWYRACVGAELKGYPYGDVYDGKRCNGSDAGHGTTVAVTELAGCEGGPRGVLHMSGNAIEWVNACEPNQQSGKPDLCELRGGSFADKFDGLRCSSRFTAERAAAYADVGFRCCGG